jgi:hypothetical protein
MFTVFCHIIKSEEIISKYNNSYNLIMIRMIECELDDT